ncbi:helix-turn-helix transcriptional regulator [Acuticoccus kandeliae]|uniref:helix-turn-helix transcriptional regulator n=1 Tax=Acuticoccus kandeliae TaxID=2073160 RepID=UPI000D3E902D|nr:LuxR C-terminal-related transcriptional regulator [Acuticoccus kandeliae]
MQNMTRTLHCERITLLSIDNDGAIRQDSYPFDPGALIEFAENFADKDVRIYRALEAGRQGPMSTQDLMSAEEIARCPVHNEFYRNHRECWNTLTVRTDAEGAHFLPLFHRSAQYGTFDAEERRFTAYMARHLVRAEQLGRLLPSPSISADGIVAALDGLPDGMLVFDHAGQVQHMNEAARRIVDRCDGIMLVNKVPIATDPVARPLLSRIMIDILMLAGGEAIGTPSSVPLPRPSGGRPLRATAYLAPPREGFRRLGILLLKAEGGWTVPSIETVRAAGGFTPAEARLAHALIAGASIRDHAEAHGITEHTVRFHMKRIREKLGVSRQAEAVAEILRRCQG